MKLMTKELEKKISLLCRTWDVTEKLLDSHLGSYYKWPSSMLCSNSLLSRLICPHCWNDLFVDGLELLIGIESWPLGCDKRPARCHISL